MAPLRSDHDSIGAVVQDCLFVVRLVHLSVTRPLKAEDSQGLRLAIGKVGLDMRLLVHCLVISACGPPAVRHGPGRFASRCEQRAGGTSGRCDARGEDLQMARDAAPHWRGASLKQRTFKFQGRDIQVSRSGTSWSVTRDGNTSERRQLDNALEDVLGKPGSRGTPHDAFLRLELEILDREHKLL